MAGKFRRSKLLSASFEGFLKNTLQSKQEKCLQSVVKEKHRVELRKILRKWKKAAAFKKLYTVLKRAQLRNIFWSICETALS